MTDEQKTPTAPDPQSSSAPTDPDAATTAVSAGGEAIADDDFAPPVESDSDVPDLEMEVLDAAVSGWQAENSTLKEKLASQTSQYEALQVQNIRLAADFENFRKRTQKEKEELEQKIKRDTICELLPTVDNFERARAQIKPANDGEMNIHKSYQGVYKQLVESLKRLGVSKMRPEGQEFDPNYHEAMLRESSAEHPEGTVLEELVSGYMLGDRVLRHAMVKVAAAPEPVVNSQRTAEMPEIVPASPPSSTEAESPAEPPSETERQE